MLKRYTIAQRLAGEDYPSEPFVFVHRSFDIPKTIAGMIRALPPNCIAVGCNLRGGFAMIQQAERAARQKGIRIIWNRFGKT